MMSCFQCVICTLPFHSNACVTAVSMSRNLMWKWIFFYSNEIWGQISVWWAVHRQISTHTCTLQRLSECDIRVLSNHMSSVSICMKKEGVYLSLRALRADCLIKMMIGKMSALCRRRTQSSPSGRTQWIPYKMRRQKDGIWVKRDF